MSEFGGGNRRVVGGQERPRDRFISGAAGPQDKSGPLRYLRPDRLRHGADRCRLQQQPIRPGHRRSADLRLCFKHGEQRRGRVCSDRRFDRDAAAGDLTDESEHRPDQGIGPCRNRSGDFGKAGVGSDHGGTLAGAAEPEDREPDAEGEHQRERNQNGDGEAQPWSERHSGATLASAAK